MPGAGVPPVRRRASIQQVPEPPEREPLSRGDAHPPLPRDKRGWHVSPAPDGRGMPEQAPTGKPPHRRPAFLYFVIALLAINWLSVLFFQPSSGEQRVTVPFSPYFLEQVKAGKVSSVNTKGDTVQGHFKEKLRYPPSSKDATATKLFATQVPTFWNGAAL